jgi:hypothetical protein
LKTGQKALRSTALTEAEKAMIFAFRQRALVPLNGCRFCREDFSVTDLQE